MRQGWEQGQAGAEQAGGLGPSILILFTVSKCKGIYVCKPVFAYFREDKKSFNLKFVLLPQGKILGQLEIL